MIPPSPPRMVKKLKPMAWNIPRKHHWIWQTRLFAEQSKMEKTGFIKGMEICGGGAFRRPPTLCALCPASCPMRIEFLEFG